MKYKKNNIKLFIFDAYGVIMSRGYPDTCAALSRKFNISAEKIFAVMYKKYFNQAAERKITQQQAWQKAIDELGIPLTPPQLQDFHLALLYVNKPALKLARELRKNYKTLLLSKNTRSQFSACKKMFPEVWNSFDCVINTWELGLPKASKKTIKLICGRFKVKPEAIVFTDDQEVNIVEAKKMGVKTIFYRGFKQFKRELLNYLK